MKEIWKPVVGFEGLYRVSNKGRVFSLVKGYVLQPNRTKGGYLIVCLYCNGLRRTSTISRLVLKAFKGPPPTLEHQAAHNDGNKENNARRNLRWATPKENNADKIVHETNLVRNGEALGRGVLTHIAVERMRDLRRAGCTHRQISIWIGTCLSNVAAVLQRQTWTHV